MLPLDHKIAFLVFATLTTALGASGFYRLFLRIRAGRNDTESRFDNFPARTWYALTTTLLQRRTFRKRPVVSLFHSFIFYGFVFYVVVNLIDALEGFVPFSIRSSNPLGATYNLLADLLSAAVMVGVVALIARRFVAPSRRDFRFNDRTWLHPDVLRRYIALDSIIVSIFILFHVGSRAVGAAARIILDGPDRYQPFASLLARSLSPHHAEAWRLFGYWGGLGSVLLFLAYFPFTKHVHIFMAPAKYLVARGDPSGVLPPLDINLDPNADTEASFGAKKLEDLSWPRLLDAYACIQCNRCQDVCPASATGKALSPAALEINKRMELNELARHQPEFEKGAATPRPLLAFALSPEAAWACTTCGACMEVCPVQDEQMLDIIDIRRNQVMVEGEFPAQLQTAFRGMERNSNPWGISHDKRMAWTEGLDVPTMESNPNSDVLYWVGCAASYDPQSQKTARAFVQLLTHAGVNFAVLGKQECCTGDSARRAGNEYLYRQLADQNVATLNRVQPKKIVATCPHCMNAIGNEYRQLGGHYQVVHHTEYLESLVAEGKLPAESSSARITYHDPCYLGRHNGVYDAPRNLLRVLTNDFVELQRNRENSFCCGAGGAQFWKEEEPGDERVSQNRYREAQRQLASSTDDKVLAVGCPFCKSMLDSSPGKEDSTPIAVKDVAELLLEAVQRRSGIAYSPSKSPEESQATPQPTPVVPIVAEQPETVPLQVAAPEPPHPAATTEPPVQRKKWTPKSPIEASHPAPLSASSEPSVPPSPPEQPAPAKEEPSTAPRKKWNPKATPKD